MPSFPLERARDGPGAAADLDSQSGGPVGRLAGSRALSLSFGEAPDVVLDQGFDLLGGQFLAEGRHLFSSDHNGLDHVGVALDRPPLRVRKVARPQLLFLRRLPGPVLAVTLRAVLLEEGRRSIPLLLGEEGHADSGDQAEHRSRQNRGSFHRSLLPFSAGSGCQSNLLSPDLATPDLERPFLLFDAQGITWIAPSMLEWPDPQLD